MIYRVFRGLGMGFQGLEFNRSRSSSSAAPFCDILKRTMIKYKKLESAAVCKQCVRVKYTLRRTYLQNDAKCMHIHIII